MSAAATVRGMQAGQLGLVGVLFGLTALAWALTGDWMAGMDRGPGTALGPLGFYAVAWVVMMAAMMLPSVAPVVLLYARVQERRRTAPGSSRAAATAVFVAGYLVVWAGFGLAAYALFELAGLVSVDALAWERGGRYLAGAVIAVAAAYQLTPWKDACLSKCRSPLAFLLERWGEGHRGALRMGVEHGAWCVGCCWALMAALFALGVMSMAWMVLLAGLVAVEKLLPWKAPANVGIAGLLLLLGVAVALAPEHVPALTLPGRDAMGG